MPIATLLVEGKLDAEILGKMFADVTTIQSARSSKNALAPRARTERQGNKPNTYYVRDRDYDYHPPDDPQLPEVDRWEDDLKKKVLGWRWCRHSLECYMLEPAIVVAATRVDRKDYLGALTDAGRRIRYYQAARWAIGAARYVLPPNHEFQTFPAEAGKREFYLPNDLGEEFAWSWSRNHAATFLAHVQAALNEAEIERVFREKCALFSDEFCTSADRLLAWFSGKDLMTAMAAWASSHQINSPGDFRMIIANWINDHPDQTLEYLEEWKQFKEMIRSYP